MTERLALLPCLAGACPNPGETDAMHQRLLHFAVDSRWSDREVRQRLPGSPLAAPSKAGATPSPAESLDAFVQREAALTAPEKRFQAGLVGR